MGGAYSMGRAYFTGEESELRTRVSITSGYGLCLRIPGSSSCKLMHW